MDAGYACVELARQCLQRSVIWVTRLRANARLFELASVKTGKKGQPRQRGQGLNLQKTAVTPSWRKHTLKGYKGVEEERELAEQICLWAPAGKGCLLQVRLILCRTDSTGYFFTLMTTDMHISAKEVVELYILRWNQKVTHREVREHLGMETQRQGSDLAIEQTTPLIFSLYSLTFVFASQLHNQTPLQAAQSAWYSKEGLTFSDLLHAVRGVLSEHVFLRVLTKGPVLQKFPPGKKLLEALLRFAEAA